MMRGSGTKQQNLADCVAASKRLLWVGSGPGPGSKADPADARLGWTAEVGWNGVLAEVDVTGADAMPW